MVATAMGDTGMYIHTTSPFFTPRVFMALAIWHVISSNSLEKELNSLTSSSPLSYVSQRKRNIQTQNRNTNIQRQTDKVLNNIHIVSLKLYII